MAELMVMANSFESHKARIRELYLVKDQPLKDVMSRMKDIGFDKRCDTVLQPSSWFPICRGAY
jgi:hypothetical protein